MRKNITNRQARDSVIKLEEFRTANGTIFSIDSEKVYTVYSYGSHFPMYVYEKSSKHWFANSDKYSRTTSKHQSQARPEYVGSNMTFMTTQELKQKFSV